MTPRVCPTVGLPDDAVWAVFDAAPDGIVMADEAGQILLANRQVEQLFGYGRGDLLGRSVDDLLPESLRQVHRAHRTRIGSSRESERWARVCTCSGADPTAASFLSRSA